MSEICNTCGDEVADTCASCDSAKKLKDSWTGGGAIWEHRKKGDDEAKSHLGLPPDIRVTLCGAPGAKDGEEEWSLTPGFPDDLMICPQCSKAAQDIRDSQADAAKIKPKKEKKAKKKKDEAAADDEAADDFEEPTTPVEAGLSPEFIAATQLELPLAVAGATTVTAEAKTDTVKKHLECKVQLNDHDKAVYGLELANLNIEWGSIDSTRKSAAKRYADELAGLDEDINRISGKLRDGYEHRGVECEVTYNTPKGGMKTCKRLDTGETFVETMTADELQPRLKFAEDSKAKGKKAATAETLIDGKAAYVCGCGMSFSPDAAGAYVRQGEAVKCPACVALINEDVALLGLAVVLTPPPDGVTGEDEVSPFATHCNEQ